MQSFKHAPHPPYELRRGSTVVTINGDGSITLEHAGALNLDGVPGVAGEVATSNGPGAAATWQSNAIIHGQVGAPDNAMGSDGDFYFRADGGAMTTIYQKQSGVWVGIV